MNEPKEEIIRKKIRKGKDQFPIHSSAVAPMVPHPIAPEFHNYRSIASMRREMVCIRARSSPVPRLVFELLPALLLHEISWHKAVFLVF
jgi:hypothetical protein